MSKQYRSKGVSLFTANVITTISVMIVLVLLGSAVLINLSNKSLSNLLKDNFSFSIEIPKETSESAIIDIKKKLHENSFVKKYTYISREDVKKQLIEDLGIDPTQILGYDPSVSYFVVNIKGEFVSQEYLNEVKASLGDVKIIESNSLSDEEINNINKKLSIASYILLIITVLMVVISIVLIRSIIQLNIHSKRFLIKTMQLVGAKDSFIRAPFVRSMLGCGIVAWILASSIILGIVYYLISIVPNIVEIIDIKILITTTIILLVASILLSTYATTSAVNRYLRMTSDKLYKL